MFWALRKGQPIQYRLASLRYDLRKLRVKRLVENFSNRVVIGSIPRATLFALY
jgi:hypothetical protein